MKVICVGGGLSGLAAGYFLQEKGHDVVVYEREMEPGGLCRTKKIGDFLVDYGIHVLWKNPLSWNDFIEKDLGIELEWMERKASIPFQGDLVPYPFQANLQWLPLPVAYDCLLDFIKKPDLNKQRDSRSFYDWILCTFGEGIAKYFMFPYNEKLWQFPLKDIDNSWAKKVPAPSLEEVLKPMFEIEQKKWGGNAIIGYPKKGGIRVITDKLAERVKVNYSREIIKVDTEKKIVAFRDGISDSYDCLISTMPLDEFLCLSNDTHHDGTKLKHNKVYTYTFSLTNKLDIEEHWWYLSDKGVPFYRLVFLDNLPGVCPKGKGLIQVEVARLETMREPADLIPIIKDTLRNMGQLGIDSDNHLECIDVQLLDPAYVIFHRAYESDMQDVYVELAEKSIFITGRFGGWKYTNIKESLQDGKDVVALVEKLK